MRRVIWRIKRELDSILYNTAGIAIAVFLCAMGGILLWVNGGSFRFILTPCQSIRLSLTAAFITWLLVYAVYGFRMSVWWFADRCATGRTAAVTSAVLIAYLFDLVWYALFFCTHLTVFSLIVIIISLCLNVFVLLFSGRGMILQKAGDLIVILCELIYIRYTVMYILLK